VRMKKALHNACGMCIREVERITGAGRRVCPWQGERRE